jgi:putative ABC transport system substrate-binding protein
MNRRDAILILTAFGAVPRSLRAQQAGKVWRIGFLSPDSFASNAGEQARKMFPASLRRLGYELGKNLEIEWRWGDGKKESLPALVEELVRIKVELIVARTSGAIMAAKQATRTIPIVMLNGNYPVELGIVESLARPGGNITGTSYQSIETGEKRLQLLKEVSPRLVSVAILWDSNYPRTTGLGKIEADAFERASARLGMKLQYFEMSRPEDVKGALNQLSASRIDALFYLGRALVREHQDEIISFCLKQRLASIGNIPNFAASGGLMDYSPDFVSFFDRTASYVDRILKGARPGDLPIEQPTKFVLVLNLKTAKALSLKIPQSILIRADKLIE